MNQTATKFVRIGSATARQVEAAAPFGRAVLHVLDSLSLGMIGDLLAARGMRLNRQQLIALVDQARRAATGDPSIRLDPHAEVAYQILSRLNVSGSARQKFTPLHAAPAAPGEVSGVAYEAGLRALLYNVSSAEPGFISRVVPWLRQQALPVDHFLAMPVGGLRLVQPDQFGRMRPVPGRTATMADLLNMGSQTVGQTSARWTTSDEAAVRRSIQDAVQVLRGPMGHNARVESVCRALTGAITASALMGAATVAGGAGWLYATLPDVPDAAQLHNIAPSAYHVQMDNTIADPGSALRRPISDTASVLGAETWNRQLGSWTYAPPWPNVAPGMNGRQPASPGSPEGWAGLPSPQQPLPTQPTQVQPYDLQADDWLTGRQGGPNATGKFTRMPESP